MAELFGFTITRKKDEGGASFTLPTSDDGAEDIAQGGFYSSSYDIEGKDRTQYDLIKRYRNIAQQPECDSAIEDIISEAVASNEYDAPISLALDGLKQSSNVMKRIREEFNRVLELLSFQEKGHDIFRRWYVDGRLFYHKVVDKKDLRKGITELRYIDPQKVKKVREKISGRPNPITQVEEKQKAVDVNNKTKFKITEEMLSIAGFTKDCLKEFITNNMKYKLLKKDKSENDQEYFYTCH